jgi:hypothetical protein
MLSKSKINNNVGATLVGSEGRKSEMSFRAKFPPGMKNGPCPSRQLGPSPCPSFYTHNTWLRGTAKVKKTTRSLIS